MTYNEFKAEYTRLLTKLLKYDYGTIGSNEAIEELSFLVDCYPDYERMIDAEAESDDTLRPVIMLPL